MATETIPPATAPPQKVSRYRTVRRAQEQHAQQQSPPPVVPRPPAPAVPDMESPKDAPVSRSMSRYHRRPTVSHATTPALPPPRANTLESQKAPPIARAGPSPACNRAIGSPQHASRSANTAQHRPRTVKRPDASAPASTQSRPPRADDSARELLQKERERQRLLKEKYEAEARAQKEAKQAELDRLEAVRREEEEEALRQAQREAEEAEALRRQKEELRAEQERGKRLRKAEAQKVLQQREDEARRLKEAERERRARADEEKARNAKIEAERPRKAASSSPPMSPPREANFGLFKRRRDDGLTQEAPVEPAKAPQLTLNFGDREPETIRPGGGGAVLGIDAPTSAVNAGDRRVPVVCGRKRILLPVTPTTTPLDLIKTAATILTEPIDVRTAVMQELFVKVSITRPLRNYEYVRDVMNSWDADNQNELTIIDSELDGIDQDDLLAYKVAETRPEGMSCFIQYSSRPGKWSKRYLTLRPDGQLVMGKNEKTKEKDLENVLTMTDYDVYSVTQAKFAKVKPPKKICFAVKSLQKSNIFADESQYVHFFCTNDRGTATMFYKALQRWRSWYLKHQKGEGLKKKVPAHRNFSGSESGPNASSHARGESVGSHYQLGAFSSLLDIDDLNKKLDAIEVHFPGEFPEDKPLAGLDTRAMHARKKSLRVKQPPPAAFNRSAPALGSSSQGLALSNSLRRSVDQQRDETFATGGLLGRGYTQRQAAAQDRELKQSQPFTEGPSLISGMDRMVSSNDSGLNRRSSVRSTHHRRESSDLRRSATQRNPNMPEPLVDLRPQYRPPPQHANKGKGYNPGMAAGPLVESATSIEEAIKLPPSTDWRARPTTQGRSAPAYGAGKHERTRSLKGRGEPLAAHTVNNHSGAPEDNNEAFTGGLLSQAGYSQGHALVGRGVMDGSKANGPMLDLRDSHQIVPGSLLANVPDSNGPIIDRSK